MYFRINIDTELYFHYQARQLSGVLYNDAYHFIVRDESDKIYFNDQCSGINKYLKMKPHFNYYVQVYVFQNPHVQTISQVKLSFSKYGEKYWLQDGNTLKIDILKSQYFLFFKNISHFEISEPIYFKVHIDDSKNDKEHFYIKYYDSDDFEKIKDSFPCSKNQFDIKIGYLQNGGDFNYNIEKNNYSQKGILLGVFIDNDFLTGIEPTSLYINVTNKEEKSEEEIEEEEEEENNKEQEQE